MGSVFWELDDGDSLFPFLVILLSLIPYLGFHQLPFWIFPVSTQMKPTRWGEQYHNANDIIMILWWYYDVASVTGGWLETHSAHVSGWKISYTTRMWRLWLVAFLLHSLIVHLFIFICMFPGFQGWRFLFSCYKTSVLDVIPSCVMPSLRAKQGGGFAFCLMPMHEEAALGPGPVSPVTLSLLLV